MCAYQALIMVALLVVALPINSFADPLHWYGDGTYEVGLGKDWDIIPELYTHETVTVKIYRGGSVGQLWMYDNSKLITYDDGDVVNLHLFNNTEATFYDGRNSMDIYILPDRPPNTSLLKLYAEFDKFMPYGLPGEGTLFGNWLSNGDSFSFRLYGEGAYSHVQFIPEPATLALFALGSFALLRYRKG